MSVIPDQVVIRIRAADFVSSALLERRLRSGLYRYDDDGELERRCARCRDYWPADDEFFFTGPYADRLHCYCKACYYEQRWPSGRPSAPQKSLMSAAALSSRRA